MGTWRELLIRIWITFTVVAAWLKGFVDISRLHSRLSLIPFTPKLQTHVLFGYILRANDPTDKRKLIVLVQTCSNHDTSIDIHFIEFFWFFLRSLESPTSTSQVLQTIQNKPKCLLRVLLSESRDARKFFLLLEHICDQTAQLCLKDTSKF